jgi:RyR domain
MSDGPGHPRALEADQVEALAQVIHAGYQRHQRADGAAEGAHSADVPWERLPEVYRESNRRQAADVIRKLAAVGCLAEPVRLVDPAGPARPQPLVAFLPVEIELLAEMEHVRWSAERASKGWTLGPVRDEAAKRTPYLVPYADLPEAIKEYDRAPVRDIPNLLAGIGYRVIRA